MMSQGCRARKGWAGRKQPSWKCRVQAAFDVLSMLGARWQLQEAQEGLRDAGEVGPPPGQHQPHPLTTSPALPSLPPMAHSMGNGLGPRDSSASPYTKWGHQVTQGLPLMVEVVSGCG